MAIQSIKVSFPSFLVKSCKLLPERYAPAMETVKNGTGISVIFLIIPVNYLRP